MPQAYITSPKRGHDSYSPPGPGRSPKTRRSGRSSRLTSPLPLSPKELANYILERGNNATSPIIAKMVLDQHLDGRALAEFADESDSEDRLGSFSLLRDRQLADDFLRTTSTLRHKLPSPEITRSTRPSLMEIASLLEQVEVASNSPESTAPAYMTPPQLSPSIPEWDLEDPETPEELEVFAPMQGAVDDGESDLLFSPGLRNFRHPDTSSSENLRGAYSSLLRPVPPFTPETMPLLSALDMRHTPYGISPSSSQGGDVGLGDIPANTQGSLPNRQASPGDVRGENLQTRSVAENEGLSAPRMSRNSSKRSTFEDSVFRTYSPRSSSCPPRAIRPQIIIPDSFWQVPPRPQRQYAEAGVQTDEHAPEAQPPILSAGFTSDAEDPAFFDAKSSRSVTESVRDVDEENDDFGDFTGTPQPGEEEHASTHDTPKPLPTPDLQPDVPTPHASTPAVSATALPVAPLAAVERVKAEHRMSSASPTAPPLARTTSEPQKDSGRKGQARPMVDTKLAQSSSKSSRSHAPSSAPPHPAPSLQPSRQVNNPAGSSKLTRSTPKSTNSSSRTTAAAAHKPTKEKERQRNTTTTTKAQPSPSPVQSRQPSWAARVAASPAQSSVTKPDQVADKVFSKDKGKDATRQDDIVEQSKTQPEAPSSPVDVTDRKGDANTGGDESSEPVVAVETTVVNTVVPVDTTTIEPPQGEESNADIDVGVAEPTSHAPPKESVPSALSNAGVTAGSGVHTNSPEVEGPQSSDDGASKPDTTAPTLLVTTSTSAGETTSANELSSEAQESLVSALSSSVIEETKSSESSSTTEPEKERKEPAPSTTADKIDATVEPSSDLSTPPIVQPSTPTPDIPNSPPPQEKPADDPDLPTSQDAPSNSTETTLIVDAAPSLKPERETDEGFVDVESQSPETPEQFENIDSSEAVGADEQIGGEDGLGDPWSDSRERDDPAVSALVGTSVESMQESQDPEQGPSESKAADVGQRTQVSTNVEPTNPSERDQVKTTESQAQGDDTANAAKTAISNATKESLVSLSAPNANPQIQQTTEQPLDPQGGTRTKSPLIVRALASDRLQRETSVATDSQTDDGGETSTVDGGCDESPIDPGVPLSAARRKALRKKAKKKEKEEKKKAEEAMNAGAGQAVKEAEEQSIIGKAAAKQAEEEAAKRKAEMQEKETRDKDAQEKAEAEREKFEAAARQREEYERKRLDEQHKAAEAQAEREVMLARQRDNEARQQRQLAQPPAKRTLRDLERGVASSSPLLSPSMSTGRSPDLENQQTAVYSPRLSRRDQSPSNSSTHSKTSASGVFGTIRGLWGKLE